MEADREKGLNEWRTPIAFYGKVVDEHGNPVAGAEVHFVWTDLSPKGSSESETTSDSVGFFALRSVKGKVLTVEVSKQGYYAYRPFPVGYFYAGENQNFVPDQSNPVVFRLKKQGVGEPLVATEFPGFAKIAQLRRDGTPVEIDLMKGAIVPLGNGQLKLELWGDPIERSTKVFNWKSRLSVDGGGLAESADQFDFEAPKQGYRPSIEINMPSSSETWQGEIKRNYFIQLPGEKYCRIELYLLARNGVYTIKSFVNPSGSRNLEPDPKLLFPNLDAYHRYMAEQKQTSAKP